MNQTPLVVNPDQVGRTSQIIVASLMMGLITFGVIAYVVGSGKPPQLGLITSLGAGLFCVNVIVGFVLSRTTTSRTIQQLVAQEPDDWRTALAPVYQTNQILSKAPLEGAGFFNGVAYIVESHWLSLAIMVVITSLMSLTFPSQSQFEAWAEQVQRENT